MKIKIYYQNEKANARFYNGPDKVDWIQIMGLVSNYIRNAEK